MKRTILSLATVTVLAAGLATAAEAKTKIAIDFGVNLGNGLYVGGHSGGHGGPEVIAYMGDEEPDCYWVKKKTKFKIAGRGTVTQVEKKWVCD